MAGKDLFVIANPAAGGGRGRRRVAGIVSLLEERAAKVRLAWTQGGGHARELTQQAIRSGFERVVVCGGDGTVHEAANALAHSEVALGIIPCGRGNDLARALHLPGQPSSLAEVMLNGTVKEIDLGCIGSEFFCLSASLGFDAEVSRVAREQKVPLSGAAAYVYALLKTLRRYRCCSVKLTGSFGEFKGSIFLCATANAPNYGGGMKIAPLASIDDGWLDICLIRPISKLTVLKLLVKVFQGGHILHPAVTLMRTTFLDIEGDEPLWVYADGERIGQTPAKIKIAPKALHVLVPS